MTSITIRRAGPLATVQDEGRFGMQRHGISASGPMDRRAYLAAGVLAGGGAGGIEFTLSGIEIGVDGPCRSGFAGGDFRVVWNREPLAWPGSVQLDAGDVLTIAPGTWGNYGYLRFDADVAVEPVLGSRATSSRVGLGGLDGRALRAEDRLVLSSRRLTPAQKTVTGGEPMAGPVRFIWGLHAEAFSSDLRQAFTASPLAISPRLDRMGVRLDDPAGIFAETTILTLVSDVIVPGDIQILGDGTPIVLMRDHQPTGGYPRIATIVSADLDHFAQMRPGTPVAFQPVTVEHAHRLLRSTPR